MSFAERFEDLEIWKESRVLYKEVWQVIAQAKDFEFRNQIRNAALSVMNNIAEGFERRTSKDFAHFLDMAKGSAGEIRSMTYAAEDIGALTTETAKNLRLKAESLSKRIAAFSRTIR